jgi:hypothetical protein
MAQYVQGQRVRVKAPSGDGWLSATYIGVDEPEEVEDARVVGGKLWRDRARVRYAEGPNAGSTGLHPFAEIRPPALVEVGPVSIGAGASFGIHRPSAEHTVKPEPQTVRPSGIPSAEAFGTPTLTVAVGSGTATASGGSATAWAESLPTSAEVDLRLSQTQWEMTSAGCGGMIGGMLGGGRAAAPIIGFAVGWAWGHRQWRKRAEP